MPRPRRAAQTPTSDGAGDRRGRLRFCRPRLRSVTPRSAGIAARLRQREGERRRSTDRESHEHRPQSGPRSAHRVPEHPRAAGHIVTPALPSAMKRCAATANSLDLSPNFRLTSSLAPVGPCRKNRSDKKEERANAPAPPPEGNPGLRRPPHQKKGFAPTIEEIGEQFWLELAGDRAQAPHEPSEQGSSRRLSNRSRAMELVPSKVKGAWPSSCPPRARGGRYAHRGHASDGERETIFVPEIWSAARTPTCYRCKGRLDDRGTDPRRATTYCGEPQDRARRRDW